MAYPQNFFRLVCSGTLVGSETFSYGISLRKEFTTGSAPDEVPAGVVDAVTAFHSNANLGIGSQAVLTTIKFNEIDVDGRYANSGETVLHELDPGVAGTGNTSMPPQVALAITLRTAKTRGRAHAGRFYIPRIAGAIDSDGRLSAALAAQTAGIATTFLDSLNTALEGIARVAVLSDVGLGAVNDVTHVEVGRVLDTMRSRRRSLDEDRQAGEPLAPAAP